MLKPSEKKKLLHYCVTLCVSTLHTTGPSVQFQDNFLYLGNILSKESATLLNACIEIKIQKM